MPIPFVFIPRLQLEHGPHRVVSRSPLSKVRVRGIEAYFLHQLAVRLLVGQWYRGVDMIKDLPLQASMIQRQRIGPFPTKISSVHLH